MKQNKKDTTSSLLRSLPLIQAVYNWRYWPMELLYLPLTLYVIFVGSLRAGTLFYFAAANPKIPLGGFAADAKSDIFDAIPKSHKPRTFLIKKEDDSKILPALIQQEGLQFPLFAKPNLGESGFLAKKIMSLEQLERYHALYRMDYLLQEFIPHALELSILIHTVNEDFTISSITERLHLTVTGDGRSNLRQLITENPRAKRRLKKILNHCAENLNNIPKKGECIRPLSLGNWDYGAQYVNRPELIRPELTAQLCRLNSEINLFHYARYDVMTPSLADLYQGRFSILEINGVKGEPIHIYDADFTLLRAYREIFKHWEYIFKISQRTIKKGFQCPPPRQGFTLLRKHYLTKKRSLQKRS